VKPVPGTDVLPSEKLAEPPVNGTSETPTPDNSRGATKPALAALNRLGRQIEKFHNALEEECGHLQPNDRKWLRDSLRQLYPSVVP
jgi:hypothetical protein